MHELMSFLDYGIETPKVLGLFHIACLIIMTVFLVLVIKKRESINDAKLRSIFLIVSAIMVVLEIYKQIVFSYNTDTRVWSYAWYIFPFQFCSTPMYILPVICFIKDGKLKDSLYNFIGTYGLFAGFAVMIVPSGVLTRAIGANIQTMYHHGAMVVTGVMVYACGKIKFDKKTMLNTMYVFLALSAIAFSANLIFYAFNTVDTFNMFYISPYYGTVIPILDIIQPNVPYIVFLMLYLLGFTAIAYIVLQFWKYLKIQLNTKFGKYDIIG